MADEQQGGFFKGLGEGMRSAAGILSPEVFQAQQQERQSGLINVARGLEIRKAQRALDADDQFAKALGGMQPSAFKTSADVMEALKGVPLDIIAESPRAQSTLKLVSTMQQREAQKEQQQQAIELKYTQLDQQRDLAEQRSQDTRLSAEERARANLAREQLQSQLLDLRRHLSDQGRGGGVPSGYRKTKDGNLEFIPGGPADPKTKEGKLGNRESVFLSRVMTSANEAAKDLENVVRLPMTASTGFLGGRQQGVGLFDAGKEVLANKMTGQEAQSYNVRSAGFQRSLAAIEASGLAPSGTLSHQMDAVLFKEGDSNFTKLEKLAQTRQIVEAGLETAMSNPRVPEQQLEHMKSVIEQIRKSVPFTIADLDKLREAQKINNKATLADVLKAGKAQGDDAVKSAVEGAGEKYEPEKYDYRVVNGKVQRKAKGG